MSDQTAMDLVGAPADQNAAAGDETSSAESRLVKTTTKVGRRKIPPASNSISTNIPISHYLAISRPPTKANHRAQQPSAPDPPLTQITASRLGLEILNTTTMGKYQAGASMEDATGAKSSKGAGGEEFRTQNQDQKEDWHRPDTVTSTAEDDRILAAQTRFLKRRLDQMMEEAREGDSANAEEQRVAGEGWEGKSSLSVEEALTMGRPGTMVDHLKERLRHNTLERERLLKLFKKL